MTELPQFLRQDVKEEAATAALLDTVERYIRLRTGGTIRALHVVLNDGKIVVTGRTATYYNSMLATHAALDAAQGRDVTNDIVVNP